MQDYSNYPQCPKCGGDAVLKSGTPPHAFKLECVNSHFIKWQSKPQNVYKNLLKKFDDTW